MNLLGLRTVVQLNIKILAVSSYSKFNILGFLKNVLKMTEKNVVYSKFLTFEKWNNTQIENGHNIFRLSRKRWSMLIFMIQSQWCWTKARFDKWVTFHFLKKNKKNIGSKTWWNKHFLGNFMLSFFSSHFLENW